MKYDNRSGLESPADSDHHLDQLNQYDALRTQLVRLRQQFETEASRCTPLGHSLFRGEEPVEDRAWQAFALANRGRIGGGSWEHWEVFPDGFSCGCYFGDKVFLPIFQRLAASGVLLLREIQNLAMPAEEIRLKLPGFPSHFGWIPLLYDTAEVNTILLRTDGEFWDLPPRMTWDDLTDSEMWRDSADGLRFPAHPLHHRLHFDLFRSSVEAISLWLEPGVAFSVGGLIDESPVSIPDLSDEVEDRLPVPTTQEYSEPAPNVATIKNEVAIPRFDGERLFVGSDLITEYIGPATNQRKLLQAFQEAGWPHRLRDPLRIEEAFEREKTSTVRQKYRSDRMQSRRETVRELNKRQSRIRFISRPHYAIEWQLAEPHVGEPDKFEDSST